MLVCRYRDHEAAEMVLDTLSILGDVYAHQAPNIGQGAVYKSKKVSCPCHGVCKGCMRKYVCVLV